MKPRHPVFPVLLGFLFVLTAARFFVAYSGMITSSEAYFWLLGERWEWASFSGPGGLPALVAVLGGIFGPDPAVLRLLGPLAAFASSLGIWWWGRRAVGEGAAFWLVVAWNCLPAVNALAMEFGPDSLLLAFWIWFTGLCWQAARDPREAGLWWSAAGVTAGAGSLVSYTMLLAPLSLAVFWLLDLRLWPRLLRRTPSSRRVPPRLHPLAWLVFLLPLLALSGPIFWNMRTHWVAFAGQTLQSLTAFGWGRTPDSAALLLWQGGLVLVVLAGIVFAGLVVGALVSREARFFLALGLLPALWTVLQVLRGRDAVLPLLLATPVLLVAGCAFVWQESGAGNSFLRRWQKRTRHVLKISAVPAVLVAAITTACSMVLFRPLAAEPDWAQVTERIRRVASILRVAGEPPLFFIASDADAAAGVGFHLIAAGGEVQKDFPPVFVRESQNLASQFGLWPRYDEFVEAPDVVLDEFFQEQKGFNPYLGRGALYLGAEPPDELPQVISNGFARVIPVEKIVDPRGRIFYLYQCEDYQTAPL